MLLAQRFQDAVPDQRMLLHQRMTDGQRVAATVFVIGLADGSIATRRDAERRVLDLLNELGELLDEAPRGAPGHEAPVSTRDDSP